MKDLHEFIAPRASLGDENDAVREAMDALDRFTEAFNARDLQGMDQALHFPHVMCSGSEMLVWPGPGQHAPDFFDKLVAAGWRKTRYESKAAVLVANDKVHFVVTYTRRDASDSVISSHTNLWLVTRVHGRWGIALRSY